GCTQRTSPDIANSSLGGLRLLYINLSRHRTYIAIVLRPPDRHTGTNWRPLGWKLRNKQVLMLKPPRRTRARTGGMMPADALRVSVTRRQLGYRLLTFSYFIQVIYLQ